MARDQAPPQIPGFDYVRELGHGGFADVYLFHQRLPSRDVAVKVLRQTASSSQDRAQFENEANRMAQLSTHPGILTIYSVGVSPDDRPYITMEYCPHAHFGEMARDQPLTVARALEVGIKVAAAVEIAHRSSILHRDVKPANILLTTYGEPALTDFGIAGGADGDGLSDNQGVSIPFAAPEVLSGRTSGDELSDVYSLGATVYALLAGRSPFSTDRPLRDAELVERVLHEELPPTGRADVPASLEAVLRTSMARDPAARYDSAAAFGRALQTVEAELGLAQTSLRIGEAASTAAPAVRPAADDDSTRFTSVQRVDPQAPDAGAGSARITRIPDSGRRATGGARPSRTGSRPERGFVPPVPEPETSLSDHTVRRGAEAPPDDEPHDEPDDDAPARPERRRVVLSIVGGLFVLVVAVLVVLQVGDGDDRTAPTTTTNDTAPLVLSGAPPRPEGVEIEPDDAGQRITWTVDDEADGDRWQVFFTDGPDDLADQSVATEQPELRVDTDEPVCVTVETIRSGRVSPASTEVCTRG